MQNIFISLGIINDVTFFTTDKHDIGSRYGCFYSHLACLDNAKNDFIIMFEDDCILNTDSKLNWTDIINLIQHYFKNPRVEYFSIGCIPISVFPIVLDSKDNVIYSKFTTTLCYAIKRKAYLRLKNKFLHDVEYLHIDHFYFHNIPDQIGLKTSFFIQNFNDTDNQWSNDTNYEEKLREAITKLYKENDFNSRYKTTYGLFYDTLNHELKYHKISVQNNILFYITIFFILKFVILKVNKGNHM